MAQMTTTEVAAEFETTPRELRKFLRSQESGVDAVGKGSRYSLPGTKKELNALRKRFNTWTEAKAKTAEENAPGAEHTDEVEDLELDG